MTEINTKAIAILEKEIKPVISRATSIVIRSADDMKLAAEQLSKLNKYNDTVKKRKEEITKPMNAALKSARALFKPLEERLDSAIGTIRLAMGTYQLASERTAQVEEDKIAARVGEGSGHYTPETAIRKMDEIDKPETAVATDSGMVKFRTSQVLKITSETALLGAIFAGKHQNLIAVDERALLAYLKDGNMIAGAELETVKVVVNSR